MDDTEALAHFRRATTIDPTFAAPYNQIGYIHLRKGDFTGAELALKQYIANRPDSANPYDSYAELLLRMGRYDESIAQYEKALAKSPEFTGSLIGIGHNHVFKGSYAKGREATRGSVDPTMRRTGLPGCTGPRSPTSTKATGPRRSAPSTSSASSRPRRSSPPAR